MKAMLGHLLEWGGQDTNHKDEVSRFLKMVHYIVLLHFVHYLNIIRVQHFRNCILLPLSGKPGQKNLSVRQLSLSCFT